MVHETIISHLVKTLNSKYTVLDSSDLKELPIDEKTAAPFK